MDEPTGRDRLAIELFERCVELAPEARDELLSRACAGDADLEAAVRALLLRDASADGFLETPVPSLLGGASPPEVLGPYRLGEKIGEGGMGLVYRAERVSGEPRYPVAIKILRRALDPAAERRLRTEQTVLGGLEHPYICRMLDAGSTAEGSPWIAMELVDGEPITRHCDEHRYGLRRRLELFLKVLEAVEHAHARLVVHGDLKPGNVLVTRRGDPKLLDFGIAAQLAPDGEPRSSAFTLTYASPEQLRGEGLTPASDVFSLGVLLFEILVGRPPIAARGLTREEILARRAVPPPPPSRIEAGPEEWSAVAAARSTRPRSLRRSLAGDLDAVALKAIAFEVAQRYLNVSSLTADLRRYLEDQPVQARRSSLAQRFAKAASRHRAAAAAGGLLVAGLVAVSALAVSARRDRDRAEQERRRAEAATQLLVESLADVGRASPSGAPPPSAVLMLERATERVRGQVKDDLRTRADLLQRLGELYGGIGQYESALDVLAEALDLRRQTGGAQRVAAALEMFSEACTRAGQYDRGEASAREALALRSGDGSDRDLVASLRTLAWAVLRNSRNEEDRLEEADALAERALRLGQEVGVERRETAVLQRLRASTLQHLGRYEEALPLARAAVETLSEIDASEELRAEALNELAIVEERTGAFGPATLHYGQVVDRLRAALGEHPEVAGALNNLGTVLATQGRFAEAATRFREALALYESTLGAGDFMTLNCAANLAHALLWGGQAAAAEPLYRRVAEAFASRLERSHPFIPFSRALVAESLAMQGRSQAAREALDQAVSAAAVLEDSGWMEPAFHSIRGAILGGEAPSPTAATLLESSLTALREQRGPWFQATLDAERRWERYRRRWAVDGSAP
jgi:serine/threonine-protein kinase